MEAPVSFFDPPSMPQSPPPPAPVIPQQTPEERAQERAVAREEARQEAEQVAQSEDVRTAARAERTAAARRRGPAANLLTGSVYGIPMPATVSQKVLTGQ